MKNFFSLIVAFYNLLKVAEPSVPQLVKLAINYVIITFFDLLGLGVLFIFVDAYLSGNSYGAVTYFEDFQLSFQWLFFAIPLIWITKFIVILAANKRVIRFSQSVVADIRVKLIKSTFQTKSPATTLGDRGVWLDTLNRQLSHTASGIIEPAMRGFFDFLLLIAACSYVFYLAPQVFFAMMIWVLAGLLIFDRLIRGRIRKNSYIYNLLSERLTRDLTVLSDGMPEFWALRSMQFFYHRVSKKSREIVGSYADFAVLTMAPRIFIEALLVVAVVVSIIIADVIHITRDELLLSLGIVGVAAFRIIPLVNSFGLAINQLRSGARTIENVQTFMTEMRVQQLSAAPCSDLALIEAVDLEKRYKDQTVFSDLSFELSAGSAAALIGPSGCGKTTLAEILATISAPDSGDVFVTLHSGARLKLSDLEIRIGFVSQNPTILDGTIFENITLMGPETQLSVDQRGKLDQALTLSGFGAILAELADGLKTIVGEEARKLSGGQKQKLSICRALFLSDGLLIFDEPTSAFDKKSETEFFENLSAIKQDHVVFVVTHSVKFQGYFDKVFEFTSNSVVATEKQ